MKKLYTLFIMLALSGCIGSTPTSRFYSLKPSDNIAQTYKSTKLFIGIEPIKIPVYLDKPQIVTRNANQVELNISEFNRWGEPLSDAMQSILASDIGKYLPNATVKPSTFRKEGFNYVVWIEVNKFEGSWNEQVTLDVWWSILNQDNQIVSRNKTVLNRPLKNSYDDLALQESNLLGELAAEIAAKISKLPNR